ncbi:MAG: ATP-binding cassette domain-containing protein [Lachnospiraceae bacterium]|nr:ATP-binding cassette domain-containing protein [Lachnospiraceae bacterium]
MEKDVAIDIRNVKKRYKLGQIGGQSLQDELQSWWAKKTGKEDPNSKIGTDQRLYGQSFWALNGINLTIKKGEAVGIIGRNGAGKSTLLKLLSRVTSPTEGEIDICGRITSMLEVGTGFHPEMTGRENVYMNGAILGMTKTEIDSKMEQIIEFSEVGEFIDTPVKRYSSGMYVKLAFSVAAHLTSEIMIMDEVLAVGDMAFQQKCLNKMRDAATTYGKTVLYVSHNMNTIRQLCNRCVVLGKGKVIFDGDVEEAIAIYLGQYGSVQTHYVYDKKSHKSKFSTDDFVIKELTINNSLDGIFAYESTMMLTLKVSTKKEYKKLKLRFVIQSRDGQKVGTMFSKNDLDFPKNESISIDFKLDLSHLIPEDYRIDIIAFQYNDFGDEQIVDGVYPGLFIKIDNSSTLQSGVRWLSRYWGKIRLQDVEMLKMVSDGTEVQNEC